MADILVYFEDEAGVIRAWAVGPRSQLHIVEALAVSHLDRWIQTHPHWPGQNWVMKVNDPEGRKTND